MECVKSGSDLAASPRRKSNKLPKGKDGLVAKTNPRSRAINPSTPSRRVRLIRRRARGELNPRGPLEGLMTDHVIQSAWRFKTTLDRQAGRNRRDSLNPDFEAARSRYTATVHRASRSLRDALDSLDHVRSCLTRSNPISPAIESEIEPNEWPIVPTDGLDDFQSDPEPDQDESPSWRDRLVYDFDVSETSPVVKGTWVTVSHVVSLIVDGWTWADILRSHPELSEDDIRTCVAYAMAEENSAH